MFALNLVSDGQINTNKVFFLHVRTKLTCPQQLTCANP